MGFPSECWHLVEHGNAGRFCPKGSGKNGGKDKGYSKGYGKAKGNDYGAKGGKGKGWGALRRVRRALERVGRFLQRALVDLWCGGGRGVRQYARRVQVAAATGASVRTCTSQSF
jgi:hypothetical protein